MKLNLFISAFCDNCHFIEEHLPQCKEDVEVWDVKQYVGSAPGDCRVISRRTGRRERFIVPRVPVLVEHKDDGTTNAWFGFSRVLDRLGGANRVIVVQSF